MFGLKKEDFSIRAGNFDLSNEWNILRIMCGAFMFPHIMGKFIVFGVPDPQRGGAVSVFNILQHANLNHRCTVVSGVLADECRALLQEFFQQRRQTNASPPSR